MIETQLSPHFHAREFKCKCGRLSSGPFCHGYPDEINPKLLEILEAYRAELNPPGTPDDKIRGVAITSGYRCPQYNAHVGGARSSQHLLGNAADTVVKVTRFQPRWTIRRLAKKALRRVMKGGGGYGRYPGFIHLDCRRRRANW